MKAVSTLVTSTNIRSDMIVEKILSAIMLVLELRIEDRSLFK